MDHDVLKQNLNNTAEPQPGSGYACLAYTKNGLIFKSEKRGIAPLAELCDLNAEKEELFVADKVIGKAAALLCVYCNVKILYAGVISSSALEVLNEYGIYTDYAELVPYIKNRSGDGKCPMELLSADTEDPQEMLRRIKNFLAGLKDK